MQHARNEVKTKFDVMLGMFSSQFLSVAERQKSNYIG